MESCPSWSKEHDWKSCKRPKPFRGFESLALRQKRATHFLVCCSFLVYFKSKGFEQGGSKRSLRKKTVRWTVFADVATSVARRESTIVLGKIPCSPPKNVDCYRKVMLYIFYCNKRNSNPTLVKITKLKQTVSTVCFYFYC